ncbi:MAG TPA: oligosaccharide flippase family protein [Solirubrobacteraceae bacterium]|nr:oligosaccharide flippase family protein [Solirubrobacteraceae bacterium]
MAIAGTQSPEPPTDPTGDPTRAIDTRGRTLREFAAHGVIVNSLFDAGLSGLSLLRGLILAAILSRSAYGLWGVLVVSLGVLARLKVVGISDKYIQQREQDQELAFQRAATLEIAMTLAATVPMVAALPVIAVIYGHWSLIAPGAVLVTVLLADALQSPLWIYYRRMDFVRQRLQAAVEPIVGFVVAIVLAALGAGYWALAGGVVAGAWAGAAIAIRMSPYPLRWRYDRGALKVYASFSGPIFLATACSVLLANVTAIATNAHLSLAGVGAVALAGNITAFTTRIDDLVSTTIYPVICAVQDRLDLLRESFVKSNRLALMWAMPFGVGLGLFAPDLVRFALGEKWHAAVVLLQVTGVAAGITHVGFNWDDYFRARSDTRPIAVSSVLTTIATLGTGIPLLFVDGLTGLAIGIGAGCAVTLAVRAWYLARLFEGFRFVSHAARAVLPTAPAVAVVLLARLAEPRHRTAAIAIAELAGYIAVTIAATWFFERGLLREAIDYALARGRRATAPASGT